MKKLILIFLAVLLIGGAAAGFYFFADFFVPNNNDDVAQPVTQMDLRGQELPDLEQLAQMTQLEYLDLRETGLTTEQYLALEEQLPNCEII